MTSSSWPSRKALMKCNGALYFSSDFVSVGLSSVSIGCVTRSDEDGSGLIISRETARRPYETIG